MKRMEKMMWMRNLVVVVSKVEKKSIGREPGRHCDLGCEESVAVGADELESD